MRHRPSVCFLFIVTASLSPLCIPPRLPALHWSPLQSFHKTQDYDSACDNSYISFCNICKALWNPLLQRKQLFENVGVQLQEANYQDKVTVAELCEVTQSLYRNAADHGELLKQFGIFDKAKSMVKELSGGQRQKLFIVLALIPQPKVVFLDELTTGLDAKARREVWKILSDLKEKGLTIFLTSHFMDEVEALCDWVCILKKGKSVFYGTVEEAIAGSPYDKFEDAYLWYSDEEASNNENI